MLALRDMNRLTGSRIGINIVEVSGLSNMAAPIYGSTVRTDREFLVEWQLLGGDVRGVRKVQAAVSREVKVDKLFHFSKYRLYTPNPIAYVHSWPFVVQ